MKKKRCPNCNSTKYHRQKSGMTGIWYWQCFKCEASYDCLKNMNPVDRAIFETLDKGCTTHYINKQ